MKLTKEQKKRASEKLKQVPDSKKKKIRAKCQEILDIIHKEKDNA